MNSDGKDIADSQKKYTFFSDPDVIAKRAETSVAAKLASHPLLQKEQCQDKPNFKEKSIEFLPKCDIKNLDNLLCYHPVQPYPFTFISAVKRKLALNDCPEICKKAHELDKKAESGMNQETLKLAKQHIFQTMQKMDLREPLKIPDFKISTKTLDYPSRENPTSQEVASLKLCSQNNDFVSERPEKALRERVQRKLDFSLPEGPSIVSCESIEPLKAPNVSIASNFSKKKEHIRESSREKENRSKRIRKDDSSYLKGDEVSFSSSDFGKRSKSPRYVSRKDVTDSVTSSQSLGRVKNDRLHMPRESDFGLTKPKTKNFATSTTKKDSDKKHKCFNVQSVKSKDNTLDSRIRICSNESLSERSAKVSEKNMSKDISRSMTHENAEHKCKEDFQPLKQIEDNKYKLNFDNRQMKQQSKSSNQPSTKQICKRVSDKNKVSANKTEGKHFLICNADASENMEVMPDLNIGLKKRNICTTAAQQLQSKDLDKSFLSIQSLHSRKSPKDTTESEYIENTSSQSIANSNTNVDSSFQGVSKRTNNVNDVNDLNDSSIPDALLDPRRISFRDDSYTPDEFRDLVTPDISLIFRSKRRKQMIQGNDINSDNEKSSKYKTTMKSETVQHGIQLLHPTALHMQFQAELHLLDSMNESLRQVMDVEKCFYNVKHEQEKEMLQKHNQADNELMVHIPAGLNTNAGEKDTSNKQVTQTIADNVNADVRVTSKISEASAIEQLHSVDKNVEEHTNNLRRRSKLGVELVEVQTQTVNDVGTQTDMHSIEYEVPNRYLETHRSMHEQEVSFEECEIPQLSLCSRNQFEDLNQIEDLSLPSKVRTMSEISLHETTSSIKTETGTEISISTRDVTCSFNKYLDLEIAQLIKDEKQRYDKIEMLFKSREKTLHDRTKKLVKLEEQKRALRDTGQDSRISSVKKKQRALLLKLQQEKDEMNRLKELHKIASQERKLMLQKQRNMFNPQMSTKNILTKLKRSADSQSPRRLSGPMKGYDIRSNSSMSSLVDSDKSQAEQRIQLLESDLQFQKSDLSNANRYDKFDETLEDANVQEKLCFKSPKESGKLRYDVKSRKFEEKMPKTDALKLKSHQCDVESKLLQGHCMNVAGHIHEKQKTPTISQSLQKDLDNSISEYIKSESDTLVEELSKKSKLSQADFRNAATSKEKESTSKDTAVNTDVIEEQISSVSQDALSKTSKYSQVSEDILQTCSKSSKRTDRSVGSDKDSARKVQHSLESKASSKRKSSKCQKTRSSSTILTENILRSKSSSQVEEFVKHHNKRTKVENEFVQSDKNDGDSLLDELNFSTDQNAIEVLTRQSKAVKDKHSKLLADIINESKENIAESHSESCNEENYCSKSKGKSTQNCGDVTTRSQFSAYTVSNQNSADSDKNYSKSVVVRSHNHDFKTSKKLEQILTTREAALASRRNCVEEWMAWHARLRAEEDRVARMEQAAYKLVSATSVLSHQDSTLSSDTSDVEGRIELLTEKLAERRIEMSRLKREARKQAKQKLKALEANLLNQIKRYDTTIHEMRKKLECKKESIKESNKLAIESKSLAELKISDIPLKRIQDIYKNSDILRSRSESDLLSTKIQHRNILKNIQPLLAERKSERTVNDKIPFVVKNANLSELLHNKKKDINSIDHSIFAYLEEPNRNKFRSISVSSTSDDGQSEKHTYYNETFCSSETQANQKPEQVTVVIPHSANSEHISDEGSVVNSETEVQTVSDVKESRSHSTVHSDLIKLKSSSVDHAKEVPSISKSEISSVTPKIKNLEVVSDKSREQQSDNCNTIVSNTGTDSGMLMYSQKLDFLQLNNKNLNDDINSLENELKMLSEMMSRISKLSSEKQSVVLDNEEKGTLKDVSETSLKSDSTGIKTDVSNSAIKTLQSDTKRIEEISNETKNTNSNSFKVLNCSTDISELKSRNNFNKAQTLAETVSDVISALIPKEKTALSETNEVIDFKARSKEILNEIEKSIISEHSKDISNRSSTILDTNVKQLPKESEELSHESIFTDVEKEETSSQEIPSEISKEKEHTDNNVQDNTSKISNYLEKDVSTVENASTQSLVAETLLEIANSILHKTSKESSVFAKQAFVDSVKIQRDSQEDNNLEKVSLSNSICSKEAEKTEDIKSLTYDEIHKTSNEANYHLIEDQEDSSVKSDENVKTEYSINSSEVLMKQDSRKNESKSQNVSIDKDDWTISDSFEVCQDAIENEAERSHSKKIESSIDVSINSENIAQDESNTEIQDLEENLTTDIENGSILIPKAESTNIDILNVKLDDSKGLNNNSELDDILDVITKQSDYEYEKEEKVSLDSRNIEEQVNSDSKSNELNEAEINLKKVPQEEDKELETDDLVQSTASNSVVDDKRSLDESSSDHNNDNDAISVYESSNESNNKSDNVPVVDVSLHVEEIEKEDNAKEKEEEEEEEEEEEVQAPVLQLGEIEITELETENLEGVTLPELEIDVKVELAESDSSEESVDNEFNKCEEDSFQIANKENIPIPIEIRECLEPIPEQDSSDGEQLDNLIEVAESGLEVIEKLVESTVDTAIDEAEVNEAKTLLDKKTQDISSNIPSIEENRVAPKPSFEILKDPEYEDISEESLEVSEIFDKTGSQKSQASQKGTSISESYQAVQKFEVLRILDEISQKSLPQLTSIQQEDSKSVDKEQQPNGNLKVVSNVEKTNKFTELHDTLQPGVNEQATPEELLSKNQLSEAVETDEEQSNKTIDNERQTENKDLQVSRKLDTLQTQTDDSSDVAQEVEQSALEKQDEDALSDSSEGADTPRGVSEIEIDSPRDLNNSRLNIDTLDDDLLGDSNMGKQVNKSKTDFHSMPIVSTSEKDIEAMIDKLKASLEQPGLEVADLEAKLLRIQQLQIELEIKKLEAEEVSYYVREIPNKPPPPYTPPGGSRIPTSIASPSPPPAVIPSNIEELTAFTEKATAIIYRAKQAGHDIMNLEAPPEIYESTKESNEVARRDRRIYNTFLFDLCKETISEVYQSEYEKPGPSWTKPNVKTKAAVKIPKTVEELHDYVSKEVATLFGFKTKLQRENMVMRWSRKRRDRVDELLAREAQAEEDEWTKFHHDELAVKNGLTVAILDTLIMETTSVVKVAYAKKRKLMI